MGGIRSQDGAQEPWWLMSVGRGEGRVLFLHRRERLQGQRRESWSGWKHAFHSITLSGGRNGDDSQTCWTGAQGGS